MNEIDLSRAEWRKSSYSSQDGNCVEVASNLPGSRGRPRLQGPARPGADLHPRRVADVRRRGEVR